MISGSCTLRLSVLFSYQARLLHIHQVSVVVYDDFKAGHAHIGATFLWKTFLNDLIELFFNISKLLQEYSPGEDVILPGHFSCLLTEDLLMSFNLPPEELKNLTVNLHRGYVPFESSIIYHIAGFLTDIGRFHQLVFFVKDQTGEKGSSTHMDFNSLTNQ